MRQKFIKLIHSRWSSLLPIPFWGAVIGIIFFFNTLTLNDASYEMARQRGEVAFTLVQTMRHWNSRHGGVYAPLNEETPENPYLETSEITITSPEGVMLTKINPAYMTRQISNILAGSNLEVRLTSDRLINPDNAADDWETEAMEIVKQTRQAEFVQIEEKRFRYLAPLYIETACLDCHAGYQVGDFRGALSVSFPVEDVLLITNELHHQSRMTHIIAFLALTLTGILAIHGLRRITLTLNQERSQREEIIVERTASLHQEIESRRASQKQLNYIAHHDELTHAKNRRWILKHLEELVALQKTNPTPESDIAILMMDIDHFKQINDQHGHDAGDSVLRHFVRIIQKELRQNDHLGRYGGEEFIILLRGTSTAKAFEIAERLRQTVAIEEFQHADLMIRISTSIGVSFSTATHPIDSSELISRSDQALYQAKREGRNQTKLWPLKA